MMNFDELTEAMAHATTDAERLAILREHEKLTAEVADEDLAAGLVAEYEVAIGRTRQAHRALNADTARVLRKKQITEAR